MTDRLSSQCQAEVVKSVVRPAVLAFFDLEPDPVYCWSGVGTINWNSINWLGVGTFGEVSSIEETIESRSTGASFRLSGVQSDLISSVISTTTSGLQGRRCKLYLAFMSELFEILYTPVCIFDGLMDTTEVSDGGQTATINLFAENRMRDLERPRTRRYTDEDQQVEYNGDVGFMWVWWIQETNIDWGVVV